MDKMGEAGFAAQGLTSEKHVAELAHRSSKGTLEARYPGGYRGHNPQARDTIFSMFLDPVTVSQNSRSMPGVGRNSDILVFLHTRGTRTARGFRKLVR